MWSTLQETFHSSPRFVRGPFTLAAGVLLAMLAASPGLAAPSATPSVQVWVYSNTEQAGELPRRVPVVVSFKGTQPSAVFELGCGSNNSTLFEAFGFARDLDLDTVDSFDSFEQLKTRLETLAEGKPLPPIQTLRCPLAPEQMRKQLLQVYRLVDDDPEKEPASPYLLRFSNDPDSVYSLECLNLLTALSWTQPGGRDLEQVSIPINQAVYETWQQEGIQPREIHCAPRTRQPFPPVSTATVPQAAPPAPEGPTQLFKVADQFDGINSAKALYLISGGKGYALDCTDRQDELKMALGLDPSAVIEELTTSDARYTASGPRQQPVLRCSGTGLSVFESLDEQPPPRYFRFGAGKSLVRFACAETSAFFSQGAPEARKVLRAALPHLLPDLNNDPTALTPVLSVGCAGLSEAELTLLRAAFFDVFGRNPQAPDLDHMKSLYRQARPTAPPDPKALARIVKHALGKQLLADATQARAVMLQAIREGKMANRARPRLDEGKVWKDDLAFFQRDVQQGGDAALGAGIYKWIHDRVMSSRAVSRAELSESYHRAFGCKRTRQEFGKCPSPEGISFWTGLFYDPSNTEEDFSLGRLIQGHEQYLASCAAPGGNCGFEIENLVARACSAHGLKCRGVEKLALERVQQRRLCANFRSIDCFVRGLGQGGLRACRIPTLDGGTCP